MNLIDLYRKNPNCKVQRVDDNGYVIIISFVKYECFSEALNDYSHGDVSNIADDWEIVKTEKKVVVQYYNCHENLTRNIKDTGQEIPPTGILLTHTIEWKE